MDLVEFESFSVVVQHGYPADIVPRTKDGLGYFTFSGSDLQPTTLDLAVLGAETKNLTIEPYYINTEFLVINCIPLNVEFLAEYGGSCSELHTMKLVGKTKDVFTRYVSKKLKSQMVKAATEKKSFAAENSFPFGVSMTMVPEISSEKRRFFSCSCEDLVLPQDFSSVDVGYLLSKSLPETLVY